MRTLTVLKLTLLVISLEDVDSCPEVREGRIIKTKKRLLCSPLKLTDSSWSLKVETAPDSRGSALVASWEGERLACRSLVMLSASSSVEEMMSLPVSGLSGSVRLPGLASCDLLRVRLASLVTGKRR